MDTFTIVHVIISLIGIVSGLVVLCGMFTANRMPGLTLLFLVTTAATSITGFFFPFHGITPAIIVGIISLIVLTPAIVGLYAFHLAGSWRWIYVVGAVVALYFNVFVLVAQSFMKVPALHALAPTGSEPPFGIAQGIVLVLFVLAGIMAVRRFRPPGDRLSGTAAGVRSGHQGRAVETAHLIRRRFQTAAPWPESRPRCPNAPRLQSEFQK